MVSGPPCQQCGYPLRWFPDQNAWGCDRCRQMFPAQMQPQMQPMPAGAPPRKGSGMKLAIGGLVVIGAIVTIAVVASGGKSKDKLDKNDLAIENLEHAREEICACTDAECVRTSLLDMDSMQKSLADHDTMTKEQTEKGRQLLEAIGECVKAVPGTEMAPAKAREADDMLRDVRQIRDRMCACANQECAATVADEFHNWLEKYKSGFDALPASVRAAATDIIQAEKKCREAISRGEAAPAQPAKPAETASADPPDECADWKTAIDSMDECDNFPKESAKALKGAYLQLAASWRSIPRDQVVKLCKEGAESIHNAVKAACPE